MSTVADIEKALRALPIQDARTVADWLQEYLEDQWDRQIAQDAESGKLDKLGAQALDHYNAGQVKPLGEPITALRAKRQVWVSSYNSRLPRARDSSS